LKPHHLVFLREKSANVAHFMADLVTDDKTWKAWKDRCLSSTTGHESERFLESTQTNYGIDSPTNPG
jgi:hypothetical protein